MFPPALHLRFQTLKNHPFASLSRPSAMSSNTPSEAVPHISDNPLFCCTRCYVLSDPRGPVEKEIFRFGFYMANLTSSPSGRRYLPSALSHVLERAPYIVRHERWLHAQKDEIRYFMPHPRINKAFVELRGAMVAESEKVERWLPNKGYLKFRCDEHTGPWLTCFLLHRGQEVLETVPLTEYEPKKGSQKSVGKLREQHYENNFLEQGSGKQEVVGTDHEGPGFTRADLKCSPTRQRKWRSEVKDDLYRREGSAVKKQKRVTTSSSELVRERVLSSLSSSTKRRPRSF